ncbi:MAG: hypothetical protein BM555_02730 [Crocinitomix sp. MedPE-SWsnd]|nr:MAG: hypothetical protein BM555_02730 [Crocinitomix sp. MedPE-SWsnd]
MKKTILMFAAAGLMMATPSCKKGENDPFLSLSSRKSRVAGEWEMSNYVGNTQNTEVDGDFSASTSTYSGGVITTENSWYDAGSQTTTSSTNNITVNQATWSFMKDGTFSSTMNTTSVSASDIAGFTTTTTTVSTSTSTGNWSFIDKVKDSYKKKERMILNTLTETGSNQTTSVTVDNSGTFPTTTNVGDLTGWTNNYYSGETAETWEIDQLKGKEMIVKMMNQNSGTYSITPNGGATTTSTNDVYTGDITITMAAVK